jgi:nucleoside-diphosphate-sugar epimerase
VFRGADAVVHLAWELQPSHDLAQLIRTNIAGSERVFTPVARAGVPVLVYASSVGAYSRGPKDHRVDETWPVAEITSSFYSRHKVEVERLLDRFEREHPDVRVARLRPGLVFSREAASEIRRFFIGPLFPAPLAHPSLVPFVPRLPGLAFQCVHSADVADAYARAVLSDARGAFNVAAEPGRPRARRAADGLHAHRARARLERREDRRSCAARAAPRIAPRRRGGDAAARA